MISSTAVGHTYFIILYVIWLGPGAMFELVENKVSFTSVGVISMNSILSGFL